MSYVTAFGAVIPALGLGTWQMRGNACRIVVERALEEGYRHLDTAQLYGNERQVGQAIRASGVPREDIFLTTKVWWDNLAYGATKHSTEQSLRHLNTPYVDLLLIHWPNSRYPLERTLDALVELKEAGRTRHIGVSNFPVALLNRALDHAPIVCNQVEYHPYLGQRALAALCRERDVALTAYCPLARGKVASDPVLERIGAAHGRSAAQVALRWLVQQEQVCAIPKAISDRHRRANLEVFDFELSPAEMAEIDGLDRGERLIDPQFAPRWDA